MKVIKTLPTGAQVNITGKIITKLAKDCPYIGIIKDDLTALGLSVKAINTLEKAIGGSDETGINS